MFILCVCVCVCVFAMFLIVTRLCKLVKLQQSDNRRGGRERKGAADRQERLILTDQFFC